MSYTTTSSNSSYTSIESSDSFWMPQSSSSVTNIDVENATSKSIPFKKFLTVAFRLQDDAFRKLYDQAGGWISRPAFVERLDKYKMGTKNQEDVSVKHVEELGNLLLQSAMDDHGVPDERRIRLASTIDADIKVGRKPDIAIVPHTSVDSDLIRADKFEWRRTLGALQVFVPVICNKKRKSNSSEVERRPSKRSKTGSTTDAVSVAEAIAQVVEHNTGDTFSDAATDVDAESTCDDLSVLSSGVTLNRRCLEDELVGAYVDMFASEGDRAFSIGACVHATRIKLMLCSHSGIIESDEIDFVFEPQLFAIFLSMFATSTLAELGFNTKTGFCNPFNIEDSDTRQVNVTFQTFPSDNSQTEQPCLVDMRLGQKIVSQTGLVGRGTAVYRLECSNYSPSLVIKYSWQVRTDRREDEIIRAAREADPVHIPELFGTAVSDDCSPFNSLRDACLLKSKQNECRELRVMVMREYLPLVKLGFGDEFWDVFTQFIRCTHELYRKKKILHHDISLHNLAFYRSEARKPVAVLLDFDLATIGTVNEVSEDDRVGTIDFMSREHLLSPHHEYGLHHDLESFFYCAMWHGLGYETMAKYPCGKGQTDDILREWRTGDYISMGYAKNIFISLPSEESVFDHFIDEDFGTKCKLLLWKFKETTMALFFASGQNAVGKMISHRPTSKLRGGLPTKVTAPMLIEALGGDDLTKDCEEACCVQMYVERENSQLQ